MKSFFAFVVLFIGVTAGLGQNEQAPIVEKQFEYKNWTYAAVRDGEAVDLRQLTTGKKLVIVVYFAPWCPNWKHDAPMLQRLYDKYKGNGLEIVAVGEYDPVMVMKANLDSLKLTFPAAYESELRTDRDKNLHNTYRRLAGDTRKWGSPWYIFLETAKLEKKGDVLTTKTHVINGEMIEAEGEKFIREKLGLPPEKVASAGMNAADVCDPAKPTARLTMPDQL